MAVLQLNPTMKTMITGILLVFMIYDAPTHAISLDEISLAISKGDKAWNVFNQIFFPDNETPGAWLKPEVSRPTKLLLIYQAKKRKKRKLIHFDKKATNINGRTPLEMVQRSAQKIVKSAVNIALNPVTEILRRYKKSGRKKKRKKSKKKNKNKLSVVSRYKCHIKPQSDIEHEKKIKECILTNKWYGQKRLQNADIYGAGDSNGRLTLSLEVSEFMRRCEKIVKVLKNGKNEINLIPISVNDKNKMATEYVFIAPIDTIYNIDIGISFKCVQTRNPSDMEVVLTGFHLNPKLLCNQCHSNGLRIGYLNIYSQTEQHYKYRYNKLLPFIRDFITTESSKFNVMDWKDEARKLWVGVVGTVIQL